MFHLYTEQILTNVYISGIILASEVTEMNKTDNNPLPRGRLHSGRRRHTTISEKNQERKKMGQSKRGGVQF